MENCSNANRYKRWIDDNDESIPRSTLYRQQSTKKMNVSKEKYGRIEEDETAGPSVDQRSIGSPSAESSEMQIQNYIEQNQSDSELEEQNIHDLSRVGGADNNVNI